MMRTMAAAMAGGDAAQTLAAPAAGTAVARSAARAGVAAAATQTQAMRYAPAAQSGTLATQGYELGQAKDMLAGAGDYTWAGLKRVWNGKRFTFRTFYHPYSCLLIEHLNRFGIEGVLAPDPRNGTNAAGLLRQGTRAAGFFDPLYDPAPVVNTPYPVEEFDFSYGGAYSQYNWELFFHVPLLIAVRLMQNQRFAEAQKWFHYVFDPTEVTGAVPERFWKFRPFHEFNGETQIARLMVLLSQGDDEMEKQVAAWEADPFDPHTIAGLRTVAYMRTVVMKYVDNLVAWGDYLFRQDTMETINEATQLYVLADQILGRRPEKIEGDEAAPRTFNELYPKLDEFSNALVKAESSIRFGPANWTASPAGGGSGTLGSLLYFCIPGNPTLLRYWDTVADRLFKIRNCMNIEGVRRSLALFDPPVDPGMLVRAAASGVDLSSALGSLFAPLPGYRFTFMAERAVELARDVQALGAALLAALERKDGEELTLLRAGHERDLLRAVEEVKKQAVREAELAKEGFEKAKEQADLRQRFYSGREFISAGETAQLVLDGVALIPELLAMGLHLGGAMANLVPNFSVGIAGFGGSPNVSMSFGGSNIAGALGSGAAASSTLAGMLHNIANMVGTVAGYERRQEEWDHHAELAKLESLQMQAQIDAADVRILMAERELRNHELQIDHSVAVYDFLRTRFTSRELYGWMITQISTLYFQAYQLAFETARRAERTFRHELGTYDTGYIQFGYWDSLKKGLLAGERLLKDVRRMQMAYVEQNRREQELVKHVSLLQLSPAALLSLRETGACEFSVPEVSFDLDFPGQYMRRIKSVSVTLPCVAGPYTTISGRLTLLNSRVRTDPAATGSYAYTGITDPRFLHNLVGIQSISTSSAQADSGLFELSFRDERYLPFEGAGAVSTWRLELPGDFRQFDYDTISDVVLHLSYTAREGGDLLKAEVRGDLEDSLNRILDILSETETGLERLVSLRHEFPNEFHQMLHPPAGAPQATTIELRPEHFPYVLHDRDLSLLAATVYIRQAEGDPLELEDVDLTVKAAAATGAWNTEGDLHSASYPTTGDPLGTWALDAGIAALPADQVEDIYLLLRYTATA
jgi:hypothetical protein